MALAVGCGPGSSSSSSIDVTIDVDPALGLKRITVDATATGKPPISQDLAAPSPSARSTTVHWTILVLNLKAALDATIVANGFGDSGGPAAVTAFGIAHLVPGSTVAVTLRLDARCAGIRCPADQSCSMGNCVPQAIFGGGDGGTDAGGGVDGAGDGPTCTSGMHLCGGTCVDDNSPDHCGSLCAPCENGFGCSAGACKTACATSDDCHPDYFCDTTNAGCHSGVVSVACGTDHTCAALKDGRVICWGGNYDGQLGNGTTDAASGAVQVSGIGNATFVRAQEVGTCAVTLEGRASCWGNYYGPGTDTFLGSTAPVPVMTSSGELTGIKILELGLAAGCAVTSVGTYCWGQNVDGSLGIEYPPTDVSPATLLTSAGVPSLLGAGQDFQVAAYGTNSVCPWGTETSGNSPQGQCFSLNSKVAQFAIGEITWCARQVTGVVTCWGTNNVGQVGTDTGGGSVDPPGLAVPGLSASDVVAALNYACAIQTSAPPTVLCWGFMSAAQRAISLDLAPGLQVVKLGAGVQAYSTCAIISDGSLRCWDPFGAPQSVPASW